MFRLAVRDDLELLLPELSHAGLMFRCVDDHRASLRTWLPWVDATRSPDDTASFIVTARDQYTAGTALHLVLWTGDAPVGTIGFNKIDALNRRAEVGYWLSPDFCGRGLMTDACRALLRHGFDTLSLHRIEIRCADANRRSAAVAERLHFRHEATLRESLRYQDTVHDERVYGLLRREFLP